MLTYVDLKVTSMDTMGVGEAGDANEAFTFQGFIDTSQPAGSDCPMTTVNSGVVPGAALSEVLNRIGRHLAESKALLKNRSRLLRTGK